MQKSTEGKVENLEEIRFKAAQVIQAKQHCMTQTKSFANFTFDDTTPIFCRSIPFR